jgi:hypothetical protein
MGINSDQCSAFRAGYFSQTIGGKLVCKSCPPQTYSLLFSSTKCHPCELWDAAPIALLTSRWCALAGPAACDCDGASVVNRQGYWLYNADDDPTSGRLESRACSPGACLANATCAAHRRPYAVNRLCGACEDGYALSFDECVGECRLSISALLALFRILLRLIVHCV